MLKIFPTDKINRSKNALFFHSQAPTHYSFTVWGIFHFRIRFIFVKVYIFVEQNAWAL